tara:strand:+ start:2111 stop:2551 length:441 start_codon:yes stop_codon:yes gene_type:complete
MDASTLMSIIAGCITILSFIVGLIGLAVKFTRETAEIKSEIRAEVQQNAEQERELATLKSQQKVYSEEIRNLRESQIKAAGERTGLVRKVEDGFAMLNHNISTVRKELKEHMDAEEKTRHRGISETGIYHKSLLEELRKIRNMRDG